MVGVASLQNSIGCIELRQSSCPTAVDKVATRVLPSTATRFSQRQMTSRNLIAATLPRRGLPALREVASLALLLSLIGLLIARRCGALA
jgi:hypothetical protein